MERAGCIKLFIGPMFSRKCLGKNTVVMMADGSVKLVQDIKIGDLLMGDDSKPRKVLSLSAGVDDLYRVKQSNAEDYIVNSNHILSLKYDCFEIGFCNSSQAYIVHKFDGIEYSYEYFYLKDYSDSGSAFNAAKNVKYPTVDIQLQDYLKLPKYQQEKYYGYRVGIDFQPQTIAINPYILGLWLSDEILHDDRPADSITVIDDEIANYLTKYAKHHKLGIEINGINYKLTRAGLAKGELYFPLNSYGLFHCRHIPDVYKYNTEPIRICLLAGILDGAAQYTPNKGYTVRSNNIRLMKDIVYLAKSLGFTSECRVNKKENYFFATITGDKCHKLPLHVVRKIPIADTLQFDCFSKIAIEPVGKGEYYGFEIDGNRRFLLGDFTVTHNTSSMCDSIERYRIAGKKCAMVKYAKDTRYDHLAENGGIVTHAGREHSSVPIYAADNLTEIYDDIAKYSVIGIDEVQFFKDSVEIAQKLANSGKIVICAGLDGDFMGRPFGRVTELVPIAEDITKLKAVCMRCHEDASFTYRISNDEEVEVIGGSDKYIAVCRSCMWQKK